jgi:hypothetical protein
VSTDRPERGELVGERGTDAARGAGDEALATEVRHRPQLPGDVAWHARVPETGGFGAAPVYERRMRNLIISCTMLAWLAACGGAGSREAALAKTARYQGDKLAIFAAIKSATEAKHKLAMSDETTLTVQTIGRWYTPEGLVSTTGDQDIRQVPDRSINIVLTVKLLPEGDKWIVDVQPKMTRINKGSPLPENLSPTDASLPGWASGKVDQLARDSPGAEATRGKSLGLRLR